MKKLTLLLILLVIAFFSLTAANSFKKHDIVSHVIDLKENTLQFYLKDEHNNHFKNINSVKQHIESKGQKLIFAMNGGIYKTNNNPLGLYVENGKTVTKLNTVKNAFGNFYMQPNGVFYITKDNKGGICKTDDFKADNIWYATQSGPLLIHNGSINAKFNKTSTSLNIRNGVGVLPNGNIVFAMSTKPINFYNFASYFKEQGCKYALYLDGYVSKLYLPEKGYTDLGGNFGVIMAESK